MKLQKFMLDQCFFPDRLHTCPDNIKRDRLCKTDYRCYESGKLLLLRCFRNLNWMTEFKRRIALAVGIDLNLQCSEGRKSAEGTRSNR